MLLGKVGDLSFVALLLLFRPAFYPLSELQGAQVHASGWRSTRHAPRTGRPLMLAISFRYGSVPLQLQKGFGCMFWVGWKLTRDCQCRRGLVGYGNCLGALTSHNQLVWWPSRRN
eukprot:2546357-Rhodomonas_salina.1